MISVQSKSTWKPVVRYPSMYEGLNITEPNEFENADPTIW